MPMTPVHKHEWVAKEKFSGSNKKGTSYWVQGYVCKCGKVDYVDMSNKYRAVNKDENLPGAEIIQ